MPPCPLLPERIPFTVIGGFLGAGKTTLLKRWLQQAAGRRIAVLVNDFGAINIDAALVAQSGAETIALSNGCVCCSIGDDLSLALLRVLDSQPPFDAVVVEASGVSDPWRIAQYALADPRLALQAVIVLVDADALASQAADPLLADTLARQLVHADLVVLNKADLAAAGGTAPPDHQAPDGVLAAAQAWVSRHAPGVSVLRSVQADLPVELLGELMHTPLYTPRGGLRPSPAAHGGRFMAWSDRPSGRFDLARLRNWLRALPTGVLRLKALLPVDSDTAASGWVELQFAGRHGSLRRLAAAPRDSAAVVAIGLAGHLPIRAIADGLATCADDNLAAPTAAPIEARW
jgi:G3E family GTPase